MKILLAVDGSAYSTWAAKTLTTLQLAPESVVTVLTVIPEHTFLGGLTLDTLSGGVAAKNREETKKAQGQRANELVQSAVGVLEAAGIKAEGTVGRGKPAEEIIRKADRTGADLVALGAKGIDNNERFELGTVAHKVMKYAGCNVLLARKRVNSLQRVLLATDGSKYSDAASQFLLDLALPGDCEILVIAVLQSHIATWMKTPTLDFEMSQKILAQLQKAEEDAAGGLVDKTRKAFRQRRYRVSSMVRKGEPADEILATASVLNPDIIVLGAKGLTGIERFLLGGVAQRVARYAKHSVLVVRQR
jgi:nucleotide-binding universal stress UspA family protein